MSALGGALGGPGRVDPRRVADTSRSMISLCGSAGVRGAGQGASETEVLMRGQLALVTGGTVAAAVWETLPMEAQRAVTVALARLGRGRWRPDAMSELAKITDGHRRRRAVVYVRQSSPGQVERNVESTALQYALADRAVALGWPAGSVSFVDEDLGRSGASTDGRLGFKELVAEVGLSYFL